MAVTIITEPNAHNSVFNPNIWVFNSTNKTNDGFRYIVEVIDEVTSDVVARLSIAPRPTDSYGEVNLSKILQSKLFMNVDFSELKNNAVYKSNGYCFNYKLRLGEEYFSEWKYYDTEFVSGHKTKAVGSTAHPFQVGDVIQVLPTTPSIFPQFSGVLNVIDVPNTTSVTFDVTFRTTPANAGSLKFADNRKISVFNSGFQSIKKVYKSSIDFNSWKKTKYNDTYILDGVSKKEIPTTFKSGFVITPQQDLFFAAPLLPQSSSVSLIFKRNDNVTLSKVLAANNFNYDTAPYVNATYNIAGLFTPNLKYYDFWIESSGGSQLSKKIRIHVDHSCSVNDTSILFEDRLGSLQSLAFKGFIQNDISIDKETYNQPVKFDSSGEYDKHQAKGTTISSLNFEKTYTLNSFPIQRSQDLIFEDLITSSNTWIKFDGHYYPCEIVTTSASFRDLKQTGLRTRTIQVKLSNKEAANE